MNHATDDNHRKWNTLVVGLLLLVSGLTTNYVFERHNIFKLWENSRYLISWADIFYPPLCVLLSLTGIVLIFAGAIRSVAVRGLTPYVFAFVIPLTIAYTIFAFGMQFVATGADRLGECPGLDQAASTSNVIPDSKVRPGHSAVGCSVERRGIFLSFYNDMSIYGVTDAVAQQSVLDRVAEGYTRAHTHPVQVMFYENENWTVRHGKNGVTFGSRGPERLIRIVNIG
jgi:hypothetical protein